MKYLKTFEDFSPVNESEENEVKALLECVADDYDHFSDLFENLSVELGAVKDDIFFLMINGKKYGYSESPIAKINVKELAEKFTKIAKYSAGKALAWVKKNSALASRPQDEIKAENA